MLWIKRQVERRRLGGNAGGPPALRAASVVALVLALCALALLGADDKRLHIFAPQGHFEIAILDRKGHEYVRLPDLLEPLGAIAAKADGNKYRLRFRPTVAAKEVELQFNAGKTKGKAAGRDIELPAPFLIENGAGLVPLAAVPTLLVGWASPQVEYHGQSRRLILGNVAVHYSADLQAGPEPKLVLHFSAPVDPTIATEPGRLHLNFGRSAVVGSGNLPFEDKQIASANFVETPEGAELIVSGSGSLMATFSSDSRTITISPAPVAAPQPQAPTPTAPAPQPAAPSSPPIAPAAHPRFMVAIDAAHGGTETGAMLPGQVPEKVLTLVFARRIQTELEKQGIPTFVLRDGDTTLTTDQRAAAANASRAALYVAVHVAAEGHGVRVFTERMAPPPAQRPAFLPCATAQSWFLDASRSAAGSVAAEFSKRQIAVAANSALLPPLNNVAGAAIAIEIAPPGNDIQSLNSPLYQQTVASSVAAGIAAVRSSLEAAR